MKMKKKKGSETMPNPEVKAKANRRRFGKDDILQILGEADNAKGTGRVAVP